MVLNNLQKELQKVIEGEVVSDEVSLKKYSRDASLFEVTPQIIVFPKNRKDVQSVINFVNNNRHQYKNLSITGRAAGTDMTGGPINEGIILDFTKYFKKESVNLSRMTAIVEPGVFYRDFELDTLPKQVSMPVYPASKSLAALGGMIMNNCGGEKSLRFGQMRNFVNEIKMVLANGNEYVFRKLSMSELEKKMEQTDFEGEIYKRMFELVSKNYDLIKNSKPKVAKNSSGYALWDIYNKEEGTFDLSQLFVGSQGTLGIMSEAEVRLVETNENERLVVMFFDSWSDLPSVVNDILPFRPDSMETFDDTTLKLGLRFMPEIAKKVGKNLFSFIIDFIPEFFIGIRMMGLPKLIVLIEIAEKTSEEADKKVADISRMLHSKNIIYRVAKDKADAEKYWIMRRESFSLLREKVKDKKTAPFIEDFCIDEKKMPEFLPKLISILKEHKIVVNIAGHAGSGNLHIIPLMDLSKKEERDKILVVSDKVYSLIVEYGGSITAEHNDGIIRTPYVEQMFGKEMYNIFETVKDIFDPNNMFNPGKKVGGSKEYMDSHIIKG